MDTRRITPDEAKEWQTGRPAFNSVSIYDAVQTIVDQGRELAALQAEVQQLRTVPQQLVVMGTWLVEPVDGCTCGAGPGGYYGAHEPQCGYEPVVDLSTLPGFAALTQTPTPETQEHSP